MNTFLKLKPFAAIVAVLIGGAALTSPAYAHNCTGSGTITIKQGEKKGEYWYFQNGRVCGRFLT